MISQLAKMGISVLFIWVPAHGITGNELADQARIFLAFFLPPYFVLDVAMQRQNQQYFSGKWLHPPTVTHVECMKVYVTSSLTVENMKKREKY